MFCLLLLLFQFRPASATDALRGCPGNCGDISIPYPFGTNVGCYQDKGFHITCNSTYSPPKAFITTTNFEITNISINGTIVINSRIARDCYNPLNLSPDINNININVTGLPYTFSYTQNKFTGLGCDTVALNFESSVDDYSSGCFSFCDDLSSVVNGTCSGIGCCQTEIPKGLQRVQTTLSSLRNHTTTWNFSPCSYAFLADSQQFVFNVTDLHEFYKKRYVPVVMDWAIGSETCEAAEESGDLVCGRNSYCSNSTNGPGYRCTCKSGYQGNPYLSNGCQDIDECKDPATNLCSHACENIPGSFTCACPGGYHGDGKKTGNGCIEQEKRFPVLQVLLGSVLGFLFLLVSGCWIFWGLKKRRMIMLKEKCFKQNGGILLQQKLSSRDGTTETARIFTAEELEKATDNYSTSRVLGRGGNGIVYKGILSDNRIVAIKKSLIIDESQIEQFINEVVILSQVIHKNVIRILGCCLETQVPLLVYEYVSNGALHDHIHADDRLSSLSWETRLRIATETAGALSYLHSEIARPIFHRDVKTANILLDNDYMAKVSDFGASRLIPLDQTQIATLVQGTLGYLDPEYFQTGLLTEKSDVYSFGVVLAELLTGQVPWSKPEQNLASYFLRNTGRDRLFQILEPRVRNEGSEEQLIAVAEVTERCLRLKGDERPTMKEVAAELERSRRRSRPPRREDGSEEYESLRDHSERGFYTSPMTEDESVLEPLETMYYASVMVADESSDTQAMAPYLHPKV